MEVERIELYFQLVKRIKLDKITLIKSVSKEDLK